MPGHQLSSSEALPRSHYFLTVSRGTAMRTVAVRAPLAQVIALVLPLLLLVGIGCGLYLAFHDDLVAGLMRRESAMQYAYEDRIEALRQDLARQGERARADQARLDARVHDLFTREARLEGHGAVVAGLAGEQAGPVARPALPVEITGRIATSPVSALPASALGYAAPDKPHPMRDLPVAGPADPARSQLRFEDHASLLDDPGVQERLGEVEARPVAAGGLGAVDLHQAVVDPEAGQGRHDVLDHLDDRLAPLERRPALAGDGHRDVRRDPRAAGEVDPLEDDAVIRPGGAEDDADVAPGQEGDPGHLGAPGDRALRTLRGLHGAPGSASMGGVGWERIGPPTAMGRASGLGRPRETARAGAKRGWVSGRRHRRRGGRRAAPGRRSPWGPRLP